MVEVGIFEIGDILAPLGGPWGHCLGPRSRFGLPLALLKTRPKAFYEGNQAGGGFSGAKKKLSRATKVFPGRNGEHLGCVGPLW